MPKIYSPAEDSFLLSKFVKREIQKINPIKIIDIGSGSGIQAETAIKQCVSPENITITDINLIAIKHLKNKFPKSRVIYSNLFRNIKGKFDLIIFNPPYLPADKFDKNIDTTGGKKGSEVINSFLIQSKKHLSGKGRILLLTSNLTKNINWQNYNKKLIGKKRIFFEELYVFELFI